MTQLTPSYRRILSISLPIMLGSAAQNVITLSDSIFLYYYSEVYGMGQGEFAAIGFVGVFYLIIASIGYGFSKGGQIMIARRMGEGHPELVGPTFYGLLYFEMAMAVGMFLFMRFGSGYFFYLFVDQESVYWHSLDYITWRSYGVFFSYLGVAIVALYAGVARTTFIIVNTAVLGTVNIVLNIGYIFGKWGLPEMGIAGAAWASTLAEMVAFAFFVLYILWDRHSRRYRLFRLHRVPWQMIRQQLAISAPIVAQSVVGLGSWFFFFGLIENLGERELAVTNLVRIVYMGLSIPIWGLCSGVNTLSSNVIGQGRYDLVLAVAYKAAKLCVLLTLGIGLPIVFFPHATLGPVLGGTDASLIEAARSTLFVLAGILAVYAIGAVYFNALSGTGATFLGLKIQAAFALFYVAYVYGIVKWTEGGLEWAWAGEIFYWVGIWLITYWYLKKGRWQKLAL